MLPKVIHYCWFGGNPLPKDAIKCIESWKRFLPDYEIREWNEQNFDVHQCEYSSQAYEMKKYAFVSDYARFKILYEQGGLYFDTDVELIASPRTIIESGPFMGIEKSTASDTVTGGVAPGLGLLLAPSMPIIKDIIDYYERRSFTFGDHTVVTVTTDILKEHGYIPSDEMQRIEDLTIYPSEFLCPMDSTTGEITITENTVSIHHYSATWLDHDSLSYRLHLFKKLMIKVLGKTFTLFIIRKLRKA